MVKTEVVKPDVIYHFDPTGYEGNAKAVKDARDNTVGSYEIRYARSPSLSKQYWMQV